MYGLGQTSSLSLNVRSEAVWSGQSDAIHVVCMGLDRGPENDQTELRLFGLSWHVRSEAVGSELACLV